MGTTRARPTPRETDARWRTCSVRLRQEPNGPSPGQPQVRLVELLDVDVLERHHPDVLHEPRRPVHVPHPGVGHPHLEVHLAVGVARLHVHRVGQVEAALGLHHVGELGDDVPVLPVEGELHLGLVLLEILCAHGCTPPASGASSPRPPSRRPRHCGPRRRAARARRASHSGADVDERVPVHGAGSVRGQRGVVHRRAVALVRVEPVLRQLVVQVDHDPVPGHLGEHRRRRHAGRGLVALGHRQRRAAEPGTGKPSVSTYRAARRARPPRGACPRRSPRARPRRSISVGRDHDDRPVRAPAQDQVVVLLARGRGEQLGVGEPVEPAAASPGRSTHAATTSGPAHAPRPASSTPATGPRPWRCRVACRVQVPADAADDGPRRAATRAAAGAVGGSCGHRRAACQARRRAPRRAPGSALERRPAQHRHGARAGTA